MNSPVLNILLVEDDSGDADYLQDIISDAPGVSVNITISDRLENALRALAETDFDTVLLDLNLPDSNGIETFKKIHEPNKNTPVIVLTGLNDESTALKCMQEGAQDYLDKTGLSCSLLMRTIRHSIERQRLLQVVDQMRKKDTQRKDAFISHISHELRSPMASIYQFSSLLLDGAAGDINEEQTEFLEIIMRNSKQLRKMIDDLLEMSRADTGKLSFEPRHTDLGAVFDESINALSPASADKGINLLVDIDSNLPAVFADPVRVRQILTNLIDNANKFTPAGGAITVKAQIHANEPDNVLISISDTGEGIQPENAKKIFDRLYQQDPSIDTGLSGLGLGLHICKELVDYHGGRIWVDSEEGEGSNFYFTLPIYSIKRFMEPVFNTWEQDSSDLSLVKINLHPRGTNKPDTDNEVALQTARQVVGKTILHGCDVLLPRQNRTVLDKTLFVVATADYNGASALSNRLAKRLRLCEELDNSRLELEITHEPVFSRHTSNQYETALLTQQAEIVQTVERMIENSAIDKEVVA
ncbi:MAG: response regulator [Gammaproteobacteria bacterium]|nr:response regulator [Gammaproteobacteria bacterium]